MLNKLKNNKGSFAIISAILIFTVVLCITAYVDIISKRWVTNEVQSVMDVSGTNTLKTTVDKEYLFKEILASDPNNPIDKNIKQADTEKYKKKIVDAYKKEIRSQINTNSTIKELDLENVYVSFDYDKFGLGVTSKSHPQITLTSVSKIRIDTPMFMDYGDGINTQVYNSRSGKNIQITYKGETDDGKTELGVYSVTRLVYR